MNGNYKPHPNNPTAGPPHQQQQLRQAHVFPGYSNYPPHPNTSMPSVAPHMHDGMENHRVQAHPATTIPAASSHAGIRTTTIPPDSNPTSSGLSVDKKASSSLLPEIEPRKRKFILVEDIERNNRVRVKVNLDGVDIAEIPDSYREANSVYPRSYSPSQMQLSPRSNVERRRRARFPIDQNDNGSDGFETRCAVKIPVVDRDEVDVTVPRLSNKVGQKEDKLNDLGYRMSWSQSRVFAGRVIFLQRSRTFALHH